MLMRMIGFSGIGALLLFCCGCGRLDANKEFATAVQLAKNGDSRSWEKAVDRAENAMKAGGNSAALRGFHVLALYKAGKTEAALDRARDAAREFPGSYVCQFIAGKVLLETGNSLDALPPLRLANKLEPDNKDCLALLARCASRQNVADAEACYTVLMDGSQSHLAANEMGVFCVQQGRYPEAMSWFSRAASMSENPAIYLNMAILCDRYMKKPQQARRYYVKYMLEAGDRFPDKTESVKNRLRQLFTPG